MTPKNRKEYATTEDGVNYRDIADEMTLSGHTMNHSSARNYVLRAMQKFAVEINKRLKLGLQDEHLKCIAGSSKFQTTISTFLKDIIDHDDI